MSLRTYLLTYLLTQYIQVSFRRGSRSTWAFTLARLSGHLGGIQHRQAAVRRCYDSRLLSLAGICQVAMEQYIPTLAVHALPHIVTDVMAREVAGQQEIAVSVQGAFQVLQLHVDQTSDAFYEVRHTL